jgi:hypothetical protein
MSRCRRCGKSPHFACGCPDDAGLWRSPDPDDGPWRGREPRRLPRRDPDPPPRQPGPHPHVDRVPRKRGARTPQRAPSARQLPYRSSRAAPYGGHGLRELLRTRRTPRRHATGAHARGGLRVQPQDRLRSGREHRVGHAEPGDTASDRGRLGALAGASREHPQCALQRHGDRREPPPAELAGAWPGGRDLHAGLRRDRDGPRRAQFPGWRPQPRSRPPQGRSL